MCFTGNESLAKTLPYRTLLIFSWLLEDGCTPFYLAFVARCRLGKEIF